MEDDFLCGPFFNAFCGKLVHIWDEFLGCHDILLSLKVFRRSRYKNDVTLIKYIIVTSFIVLLSSCYVISDKNYLRNKYVTTPCVWERFFLWMYSRFPSPIWLFNHRAIYCWERSWHRYCLNLIFSRIAIFSLRSFVFCIILKNKKQYWFFHWRSWMYQLHHFCWSPE